ncbi:hypothetical protein D3C79_865260 [compost metagenome]
MAESKFLDAKLHSLYTLSPTKGQSATFSLGGGILKVLFSNEVFNSLASSTMEDIISIVGKSRMQRSNSTTMVPVSPFLPFNTLSKRLYIG